MPTELFRRLRAVQILQCDQGTVLGHSLIEHEPSKGTLQLDETSPPDVAHLVTVKDRVEGRVQRRPAAQNEMFKAGTGGARLIELIRGDLHDGVAIPIRVRSVLAD